MVSKKEGAGKKTKGASKGRVKVDKLKLNKETIKELTEDEAKDIKGGCDFGSIGKNTRTCLLTYPCCGGQPVTF